MAFRAQAPTENERENRKNKADTKAAKRQKKFEDEVAALEAYMKKQKKANKGINAHPSAMALQAYGQGHYVSRSSSREAPVLHRKQNSDLGGDVYRRAYGHGHFLKPVVSRSKKTGKKKTYGVATSGQVVRKK